MTLGIVLEREVKYISKVYLPLVEKIRKHGSNYPDYLTTKEIEMATDSAPFFDKIAKKTDENLREGNN